MASVGKGGAGMWEVSGGLVFVCRVVCGIVPIRDECEEW